MDESWLQNIITKEDEKIKLKDWIKYNGLDRFKRIYEIACGEATNVITYYQMTECAKYDARISRWIFKTVRIIEGHMRAMLLNNTNCYDILLSIGEVKEKLLRILSPNYADDDMGIIWKQLINKLKRKRMKSFTIAEILDTCSFSELSRFHSSIADSEMYDGCIFKGRDTKVRDLGLINLLRNAISHNQIIINSSLNYKGEAFTLKQQIEILLSYIEDKDMYTRRIKELNGYAIYQRDGKTMRIPEHYRIIIEKQ
jgi:hypothetical protein